ncbi:hypothetical protein [Haematobacter massiliensis]|uniref:hypothetical protein n=1 Tax=Haematobacter massiliensis TaxID=195105 RepID=UPI0010399990|nr:hypothetical protein [Haematobacter massiliensis]QBJ22848.1 hypothetical protein HmaOT1_00400 [Haematobacter massiliensis]
MRAFALAAAACLTVGQAEAAIVTYKFYPGNMIERYTSLVGYIYNPATGHKENYSLIEKTTYPQPGKPPTYEDLWYTFYLDTDEAPKGPFTASGEYYGRDKGVFTNQFAVIMQWRLSFDENWLPIYWDIREYAEYDSRNFTESHVSVHFTEFETLIDGNDPENNEWHAHIPRPYIPPGSYGAFNYVDGANYNLGKFTVEGLPAPVPLPAAAPLLLAGTAALWAVGRRRKARQGA